MGTYSTIAGDGCLARRIIVLNNELEYLARQWNWVKNAISWNKLSSRLAISFQVDTIQLSRQFYGGDQRWFRKFHVYKNLINPSISFIYFYLYEKLSSNICMLLFEQWRYARIRTLFVVFFRSICPIVCRLSISLLNIIMLDMVRTYIFTFLC